MLPIAFTVSRRIRTETGSALLTVTLYETAEDLAIKVETNGVLSFAFFATKESTDAAEDSAKKPSGKCTVSQPIELDNGG